MKQILIAGLFIFCFLNNNTNAQKIIFSYNINIEIEVEEDDNDKYSLTYKDKTEATYIADKPGEEQIFYFYENYFEPIDKISFQTPKNFYYKSQIPFLIPEYEDVFITNSKVYFAKTPSDIKTGDKIIYEYEKEISDAGFAPVIFLENSNIYEKISVRIFHPEDIEPAFEIVSTFGDIPFTVTKPDDDETLLNIYNLKSQPSLEFYPYNEKLGIIQIILNKGNKTINNIKPAEFVNWYNSLSPIQPTLNDKHKNFLSEELNKVSLPIEKVKIIYDYVKKNIRYLAEGQEQHSILPREPSVVLDREYGDCKEKSALISAIARQHGLKVNMAIVTRDDIPATENIYVDEFDHVICAFDYENTTIFFDPTASHCEFGNLPNGVIDCKALIFDKENPRFINIDKPEQDPTLIVDINIALDSLSEGIATIRCKNDFFTSLKYINSNPDTSVSENILTKLFSSNFYKILLNNFIFTEETESSIELKARADLSQFIISTSNKKYIPKTPFIFPDNSILERKNDSLEIFFKEYKDIELNLFIDPKGYELDPDPLNIGDFKNTLGFYAAGKTEDGKLVFRYVLKTFSKKFGNTLKAEFLKYYEQYLSNKTNLFTLRAPK